MKYTEIDYLRLTFKKAFFSRVFIMKGGIAANKIKKGINLGERALSFIFCLAELIPQYNFHSILSVTQFSFHIASWIGI